MPRASRKRNTEVDSIFEDSQKDKGNPYLEELADEKKEDLFEEPKSKIREIHTIQPLGVQPSLKLGLGDLPGRKYIFVGEADDNSLWYSLDPNTRERISIFEPCLKGYVTNIRISVTKYKDEWKYKADLYVFGDREYVVRSGISTTFAKGVILALLQVENLKSTPVAIIPVPADEDKVIFGNVQDVTTGKKYFPDRETDMKMSEAIFELQERLGVEVQSGETIQKDKEAYDEKHQNSPRKRESTDEFA